MPGINPKIIQRLKALIERYDPGESLRDFARIPRSVYSGRAAETPEEAALLKAIERNMPEELFAVNKNRGGSPIRRQSRGDTWEGGGQEFDNPDPFANRPLANRTQRKKLGTPDAAGGGIVKGSGGYYLVGKDGTIIDGPYPSKDAAMTALVEGNPFDEDWGVDLPPDWYGGPDD